MYILQNTVCVIWSHIKKKKKCSLFPNEPSSCWIDNNFPNLVKTHFFFFSLILDGYMKGCCTTGFDIKFVWKVFFPLINLFVSFLLWKGDKDEKMCYLSYWQSRKMLSIISFIMNCSQINLQCTMFLGLFKKAAYMFILNKYIYERYCKLECHKL